MRQLLFSKPLQQPHAMGVTGVMSPPGHTLAPSDTAQDPTMERILQEITAVGRSLEGMDTNISALAAETKSIRQEIAPFQNRVQGLEHPIESCLLSTEEDPSSESEAMDPTADTPSPHI
ncbi:hypothetical protein NDU88_003782 [Pleurodeles waltl]|uniref:Uncharacterized protein n=1 Tax=Pleurodeles waltl TaxID=8319 RepID=A0AAV7QFW1_PLEWA|nr:hypothetical protein NDU88_003782 [Pleurodeles waltl]